jgi:hypothetical protein
MKQNEINRMLEKHKLWLNDEDSGVQADFRSANLEDANFRSANLQSANFENTLLRDANFEDAYLRDADFEGAYLSYTNFRGANFRFANLEDANFSGSNFEGAYLSGANFKGANLSGANLSNTNLYNVNFEGVNLSRAIGNNREVKSLQLGEYLVTILVGVKIHIGCKEYSIEEWENFTDEEIEKMDDEALKWWKKWKEIILKIAKEKLL